MASRRDKVIANKRASKNSRMKAPGHKSNYARKAAYLKKFGGYGFEYGNADGTDKPWKQYAFCGKQKAKNFWKPKLRSFKIWVPLKK